MSGTQQQDNTENTENTENAGANSEEQRQKAAEARENARLNAIVRDHVQRALTPALSDLRGELQPQFDELKSLLTAGQQKQEIPEAPPEAIKQLREESDRKMAAMRAELDRRDAEAKEREDSFERERQETALRDLLVAQGVKPAMVEAAQLLALKDLGRTGGITRDENGALMGHVQHKDWKEPLTLAEWVKTWSSLKEFKPARGNNAPSHGVGHRKQGILALPRNYDSMSKEDQRKARTEAKQSLLTAQIGALQGR